MRFKTASAALLASAVAGLVPYSATAQTDPTGDDGDTIIVTGTRDRGVTAEASASPVAIIDGGKLRSTGANTLLEALNRLVPSYNLPGFAGGDLSNLVRSARLRGLSPNHVLVLVNGKRRHNSSSVNATPGPAQGSTPVDLDLIPPSAIDRVELLQDGAAAQYGSDAIAGVINIILKSGSRGGSASASAESYYKGDGLNVSTGANVGLPLGAGGFLNLSADMRLHNTSNRTGPDPRITSGDPNAGKIIGDPANRVATLSYNAGIDLGGARFYSFGTYAHRSAHSFQNYRLATDIPVPYRGQIYPNGYIPQEAIDEDDYSITAGIKGDDLAGWHWDLASTFGSDAVDIGVRNSINLSLLTDTGASPTRFDAGRFRSTQWTTNLDLSREIGIGLAAPLNLALGAEYRRETYELVPGDAASRYKEGSVAFPGYSLVDAAQHHRGSVAAYLDALVRPVAAWLIDVAGRYEHYTDFGDKLVGKLTSRLDFSKRFAVRGTVSTGFEAPSLAQQYFSATNVGLDVALVELPPSSAAGALIGAKPLKPERSVNISFGLVAEPIRGLHITLDAYRITIDDRIVNTGLLLGPAVDAAIVANGVTLAPTTLGVASYFTNGLDTRTDGIELQTSWRTKLTERSAIDWTLGANYNKTSVRHIDPAPPQIAGNPLYFDPPAINALTTLAPRVKVIFGADYTNGRFGARTVVSYYGKSDWVITPTAFPPYYDNEIGAKAIADIELSYALTDRVKLAVGANNVFDTYPNKTIPASRDRNTWVYPFLSPYGFNGGSYYARLTLTF